MTPPQLNAMAETYVGRERERLRATQSNMYSLAALTRAMIWGKRPPEFDRVFPDAAQKRAPKRMTDEQLYAQVRMINAMLGGKEVS